MIFYYLHNSRNGQLISSSWQITHQEESIPFCSIESSGINQSEILKDTLDPKWVKYIAGQS